MFDPLRASLLLAFVGSLVMAPTAGAAPSAELAKLCTEYWDAQLEASPTDATALGDHRWDDRLGDRTPAGRERREQQLRDQLERVQAFATSRLDPADQLTRSALVLEIQNQLDDFSCHAEDWVVDPLGGPQVALMNLPDYTRFATPQDARNFVARCRAMGPYLDAHVADLRAGLAKGRVAGRDQVRKVIDQLDQLGRKSISELPLLAPLAEKHPDWTESDRTGFERDLTIAVASVVKPALDRYHDFLEKEVLPKARPQDQAGLSFLPGGDECYRKRIWIETSLNRAPEELHQLGLQEVAKFRKKLSQLGGKALGTTDVAEIQKKLRSDPAMQFATAEEVEAKAREALARAKAAIPKWFDPLPKADCEVKVMGMHEAPNSTIAYYRQPAIDGSRPGHYMINTYQPQTRPRYEAEALAFHESIPGHHLQIAIAQELTGLPEFRKHSGVTAFVEGWALYTERLADEMGLYSSDLDRVGMLSYDAWRSCRLVVDTGMHAMGWSRQRAIDYMMDNTVLAKNNVENEVDRYLTWPGQALAYKCGQLEILRMRNQAKIRLAERFDIKQFHAVVLRNGAVSLPVLHDEVEAWIEGLEAAK